MKAIIKTTGRRAKVLDVSQIQDTSGQDGTIWIYERGLEEIPTAITDSKYSGNDLLICNITAEQMAEVVNLSAQLAALDHRLNELAFEIADTGENMTQARLRELVKNSNLIASMLMDGKTVFK